MTCVDEQATLLTRVAKVKLVEVGHNSNWCAYTERHTISHELKRKQRQHLLETPQLLLEAWQHLLAACASVLSLCRLSSASALHLPRSLITYSS